MEEEKMESVGGIEVFDTPEEMMQADEQQTAQTEQQEFEQPQPEAPQMDEAPVVDSPMVSEPQEQSMAQAPNIQQEEELDLDSMTLQYLSEKLGRQVESFDDLSREPQQVELDDGVAAIANFVKETGRSPRDWFAYQSMDPTNMDDLTAVKVKLATDYPNLNVDEVNLLLKSKYVVDEALATEDEINIAKLNLKIEAEKARENIASMRDRYLVPETTTDPTLDSFIDDDWISTMTQEVDSLQALEFDVADGKTFQFGLDENYRSKLKDTQANLETFFDRFVKDDGEWDYDGLSSMFAVNDNIDKIVSSAYRQGMSDGQRNVVTQAANISTASPQRTGMENNNPLADQVKQILKRSTSGLSFKL